MKENPKEPAFKNQDESQGRHDPPQKDPPHPNHATILRRDRRWKGIYFA